MQTVITYYRFDLNNTSEADAYKALVSSLKSSGAKRWEMNPSPTQADFMAKIKAISGQPINIDTAHLFAGQWNTAPIPGLTESGLRVFPWSEIGWPNKWIKEGYTVKVTDEMRAALDNTDECGYCGAQEPAQKGLIFCPHCLGSEYLKSSELHLLRMRSISSTGNRPALTQAEIEYILPLYKQAQMHGNTERDRQRLAKQRKDLLTNRDTAIALANTEYDGFTWLLDHGLKIDNVIYYDHTRKFSFGWRSPVDAEILAEILSVIDEFPFGYEITCADGRKLSRAA